MARAQALAARVVGARVRSVVELLGLAGEEHEAAIALQHWWPDCADEGNGGGISGLRQWGWQAAS